MGSPTAEPDPEGIALTGPGDGMPNLKTRLTLLWIFVTFNYLYCDLIGVMDSEMLRGYLDGNVDGVRISESFLLAAAALVEIPMAMILLTGALSDRYSRLANVVAGTIMTVVQAATLFVGNTTSYYAFFSVIEIACTASIVWLAWRWKAVPVLTEVV